MAQKKKPKEYTAEELIAQMRSNNNRMPTKGSVRRKKK